MVASAHEADHFERIGGALLWPEPVAALLDFGIEARFDNRLRRRPPSGFPVDAGRSAIGLAPPKCFDEDIIPRGGPPGEGLLDQGAEARGTQ